MHIKNWKRKSLSLILTLVLTAGLVSAVPTAMAKTSAQVQNEINAQNKKIQESKNKVSELKKKAASQKEILSAINEQIAATQKRVDLVNQQLEELSNEISEKESEIKKKNEQLESIKEEFKTRLRAMYISGGASSDVALLLSASGTAEYLSRQELMKNLSQRDREMMDAITKSIAEIETSKKEIEDKKTSVAARKKELASDQSELSRQYQEAQGIMSSISSAQSDAESEYKKAQAAKDALEEELKKLSASPSYSNIKYNGGAFAWPVPSCYSVSSQYGYRWGRLHKGIDISGSGIYGKPIVAAADGVVMVAGYNNGGYGNYVMVNHGAKDGKQFVTLYGHMSRYIVGSGQSVKKGQTIGYVGNTGRSTGPHLHFEIRVNGTAVNPLTYY